MSVTQSGGPGMMVAGCIVAVCAPATALSLPGACAYGAESMELPVTIAPDHPSIRYIGRFDKTDPKLYRFVWAGSSFVFRFEGSAVNLLMKDECPGGPNKLGGNTNNYLTVIVDDLAPLELSLEKDKKVYRIAEKLPEGIHTATVFRRNCPRIGGIHFLGLQLEAGKSLADPPPAKTRCIEVIGDSISVGYGILGANAASPGIPMNEDCYLSYGAVAARQLDADFACIAWSGFGVYRDLNNKPENVLANLYGLTVPKDAKSLWAYKDYTPGVVVINLGTNDFEKGAPPKAEFNAAYRSLAESVWAHAPKAHVFCVAGGMLEDDKTAVLKEYLTELIAELAKEGKKNIHLVVFPNQTTIPGGIAGQCHPSVKTHAAMAEVLVREIKKELAW